MRHTCFCNLGLAEKEASARNLILLGDALLAKSTASVTALVANWICVGFVQGKTMRKTYKECC